MVTACSNGPAGSQPVLVSGELPAVAKEGSAQAVYEEAVEDMNDSLFPEALQGFADVRAKFPYSQYAVLSELRVADTYFSRGQFLDAVDAYRSFLKMHPKHNKNAYAMLRIGESYQAKVPTGWWFLPPPEEQEQQYAKFSIGAYERMLKVYGGHPLSKKARQGLVECRTFLAKHELYVADFYFQRDHFVAARKRAEGMLTAYADVRDPQVLGDALWIAGRSCFEQGDTAKARQWINKLLLLSPQGEHAAKASELLMQLKNMRSPDSGVQDKNMSSNTKLRGGDEH